jgi:mycofactocin precursor
MPESPRTAAAVLEAVPDGDEPAAGEELVKESLVEESLVEEVSIDGMCGVY